MKNKKLFGAMVLFVFFVSAQSLYAMEVQGSIEFRYLSRNIWRGFDVYEKNHGAFQTELDVFLPTTGFGFTTMYSRATRSGFENQQWWPYSFYYKTDFMQDSAAKTNFKIAWTHYAHPDEPRSAADMQEISGEFAWPELFGNGLTPKYTMAAMWPSEGKSRVRNNGGWAHIFGLEYDWKVAALEEHVDSIKLSTELVYNGGFAPGSATRNGLIDGSTVDHDWSHMVFGASTEYKIADNTSLTPGMFYQRSMDDSVNRRDEFWMQLGVKYTF
ncbi:MAG: hypothetical protein WCZ89_02885 [Phycisphaerae bacterium]